MMAHVVPTKFGNAGILEQPPPRGVDLAEPLAVVVDENPPFPCQRLLAPALQYERCLAIERDMPCAPRFCGRAGHGHDAPFEIDVRPVEVEQFTPPRAGVDREENQRLEVTGEGQRPSDGKKNVTSFESPMTRKGVVEGR